MFCCKVKSLPISCSQSHFSPVTEKKNGPFLPYSAKGSKRFVFIFFEIVCANPIAAQKTCKHRQAARQEVAKKSHRAKINLANGVSVELMNRWMWRKAAERTGELRRLSGLSRRCWQAERGGGRINGKLLRAGWLNCDRGRLLQQHKPRQH